MSLSIVIFWKIYEVNNVSISYNTIIFSKNEDSDFENEMVPYYTGKIFSAVSDESLLQP